MNKTKQTMEDILADIKGLLVDNGGNPNKEFNSIKDVDAFIDDVEKIISQERT